MPETVTRDKYVGHVNGRTIGTVEQVRPDHAVVRMLGGRIRAYPLAELVFAAGRYLSPEDFAAARRAASAPRT